MNNIVFAKPIIDGKSWVITNGNDRIGAITLNKDSTVVLKLKSNKEESFIDIAELSKKYQINFEPNIKQQTTPTLNVWQDESGNYYINQLPVASKPYNIVVDAKTKNILFTKEENSVTYYCAGWFRIKSKSKSKIVNSPRLLTLRRKTVLGPYSTYDQAARFETTSKTIIN